MFNGKKLDNINERLVLMTDYMTNMNDRLIELKMLVLKNNTDTLGNRVEIKKATKESPVIEKIVKVEVEKEVIVEKVVNRARKKPVARLRKTASHKRITEDQKMEFMRLYDLDLSYTEIASATGTTSTTASKYIREIVLAREQAEEGIKLEAKKIKV